MTKLFLPILLSVALLPVSGNACPLGAGETTLTFTRVMRNFGRGIFGADQATKKGLASPASVADTELVNAQSGISVAMNCAEAVLLDRSGVLVPRKTASLVGEARERYLKVFLQRMKEFHEELGRYRAIYLRILETPVAERDFTTAGNQMRAVAESAARAHEDTQ